MEKPSPLTDDRKPFWFPGPWIGAISLIVAPLMLFTGMLLRIAYPFFFPHQLAAYEANPLLITSAYSLILMGNILLALAVLTLVQYIGRQRPYWALWGGMMTLLGLFARTFHAGIDHQSFQLVPLLGLDKATETVASSYGAFHPVSMFSPCILSGWIILAVGAFLSKTLNGFQSLALGLMSALMMGVLKGSSIMSVIAVTGLCIAFLPLGIRILRTQPQPTLSTVLKWSAGILLLITAFFLFGQAG